MSLCPCCSGKEFADCCESILKGAPAPTAESLMRARYSAYAMKDIDFLRASSCGPALKEFNHDDVKKWADAAEWLGLEIHRTEAGAEGDESGEVEFTARYKVKETEYRHHENAQFRRVDGSWRFSDGKIIGPEPKRREEPKVGRNDPCPCGSGKKYKKCCGKTEQG